MLAREQEQGALGGRATKIRQFSPSERDALVIWTARALTPVPASKEIGAPRLVGARLGGGIVVRVH